VQHVVLVSISRSLAITALLLSCAGVLRAQSTVPLSLDEALRLAAERSSQLVAEEAAISAAREMLIAAGQAPDPVLVAGVSNLPINGPDEFSLTDDFMTMRSIGLRRELIRQDKREAHSARFAREAEAAAAGRTAALTNLQRSTAVAWFTRYYRERVRAVLASQRAEAALQIEAADLAYRTGRGPQSDVFATRAAVADIDDGIAEAERDIAVATTTLARWVGDAASRALSEPPVADDVSLDAADLDGTLAHHPEIALMLKQEEIALADAQIARTNKRSDWSVELMYSQRGPDFSDMVSVNVMKPLQWRERSRQDRELAAQLATAQRLRAEREEGTRAHVAEARGLLQSWQSNRERLGRYTALLLPLASERTAAATAAYRAGSGTLDAALEARMGEIRTSLDHLMLEMETAMLWAELNYLIPAQHAE
jgi:outer membrane protein TolC